MLCDEAKERSPLLAKWGIPDKSLRRDLARVSVADGDGRDIVEAVDRDVFVVRDGDVQRPDLLAFVVYVIHEFLQSDFCASLLVVLAEDFPEQLAFGSIQPLSAGRQQIESSCKIADFWENFPRRPQVSRRCPHNRQWA